MKKATFTLIFAVIFSALAVPGYADQNSLKATTAISAKAENLNIDLDRKKKRKIKKKVRQAGKAYKLVKTSKQDKKQARKVQKKIRRVINIW